MSELNKIKIDGKEYTIGGSGGSSSGSGSTFVDVTELPESPDSSKVYRVHNQMYETYIYQNGNFTSATGLITINFIDVNVLPENPMDASQGNNTYIIYVLDNNIYGYNSENQEWLDNDELISALFGGDYGGIINSLNDVTPQENCLYILKNIVTSFINYYNKPYEFSIKEEKEELLYTGQLERNTAQSIQLPERINLAQYNKIRLNLIGNIGNNATNLSINFNSKNTFLSSGLTYFMALFSPDAYISITDALDGSENVVTLIQLSGTNIDLNSGESYIVTLYGEK